MTIHVVIIKDSKKNNPIQLGPFNESQARVIKESLKEELREDLGYFISMERLTNDE